MDDSIKQKLAKQRDNQYLAIGKFIVKFEHLFLAIKNKVEGFAGRSEELSIILEVHSVRQTIDILKKIIEYRTKDWSRDHPDKILYKYLIKDLNSLNQERNSVIHTTWFIGWRSENQTDITEFNGWKYSGRQNFRLKQMTAKEINAGTEKCEMFYRLFFTIWSIDPLPIQLPKLSELYNRTDSGIWKDLRQ